MSRTMCLFVLVVGFVLILMGVPTMQRTLWADQVTSPVPAKGKLNQKQTRQRWGRDPFVLPNYGGGTSKKSHQDDLHLSAIIYQGGRGVAVINSEVLRKGDRIGGAQIVDIRPDRVILKDVSGRRELRIRQWTLAQ